MRLNLFGLTSGLGCTLLTAPARQLACRAGSETATLDVHLGTIPRRQLVTCEESTRHCLRSHIKDSQEHARKASGDQCRAPTCQAKQAMSPSCKHFLSGRKHFLNPGATTSVAYFPANSRQRLSFFAHNSIIVTANFNSYS